MIAAIIVLSAVILAGRLWISNSIALVEEDAAPIFVEAPSWQHRARNFQRRYDTNLIKIAINDFKVKHDGRLPELAEITKSDDEGDLTWQYTDLQQIAEHDLDHYRQELGTSSGQAPASDQSFYGASARLEQADFPDNDNIHIWLGYACMTGEYDSYADVVEKSALSDFAIVYAVEELEYSPESDETAEFSSDIQTGEFVKCLGEDNQ